MAWYDNQYFTNPADYQAALKKFTDSDSVVDPLTPTPGDPGAMVRLATIAKLKNPLSKNTPAGENAGYLNMLNYIKTTQKNMGAFKKSIDDSALLRKTAPDTTWDDYAAQRSNVRAPSNVMPNRKSAYINYLRGSVY